MAKDIIAKHPDKAPIICEKSPLTELKGMERVKFLVPLGLRVGEFQHIIRKRLECDATQAIFLTSNGTMLTSNQTIQDVYTLHKAEDGFLYMEYLGENTFGFSTTPP